MAASIKQTQVAVEKIAEQFGHIHETLSEFGEQLLGQMKEINASLAILAEDFHKAVEEGEESEKPRTAEVRDTEGTVREVPGVEEKITAEEPQDNEIPLFLKEYVEAHPGCKAGDLTREFKCSQNKALLAVKKYGKKAPPAGAVVVKDNPVVDQGSPVPEEITVEVLREKITEFSRTFGMNEALQVNEQFGGNKKVSKIPTENYAAVWNEMAARLEMKAKVEEANAEPQKGESLGGASITKEDIQRAGGVFVKKYGDPAFRELLKKYVTKGEEPKISKVDPAKYPALHEALDNA